MNWTTQLPTEVGYYWYKRNAGDKPSIVEIKRQRTDLVFACCGHIGHEVLYETLGEMWLGPIQIPDFDPATVTK